MKYEQYKTRRIDFVPPAAIKQKIDTYCKGNKTQFIVDAIKEKIARIESDQKNANAVSTLLA